MTNASTAPRSSAPPLAARVAAAVALAGFLFAGAMLIALLAGSVPYLLGSLACVGAGVSAAWLAATSHRWRALLAIGAIALLLGSLALLFVAVGAVVWVVVLFLDFAVIASAGNRALHWEVAASVGRRWTRVPSARGPVLLMNPKSGGQKVARFRLVEEARRRGIEPVVLGDGDDLRELAAAAVERGADAIGMAGGDGSQAVVATVAAERGVAFVCVPAGTRNHLALDLGVDRDDVVGALDAFAAAREAQIDLATVNGRVFVNNVSLGVYAEIVRSDAYRGAKVRTASRKLPDLVGRGSEPLDLQVDGPDGVPVEGIHMLLVSNNPYRLDRLGGLGTRPRLDSGRLGMAVLRMGGARRKPSWRQWNASVLVVGSRKPVAAGVDGESIMLDAPLRFAIRPRALRVRTAVHHPGISPAAVRPGFGPSAFLGIARVLIGHQSGLVEWPHPSSEDVRAAGARSPSR